jgi:hypothetical protein
MKKRLSLLLAVVAVLAFAVPAFASAATGLTEGGKRIEVGKIITGTNIGEVTTTSEKLGNIVCKNVMVETKVGTNSTSKVVLETGGTQSASACFRETAEVKVFDIELSKLETTGGGNGSVSAAFKVELAPGGPTCSFVGTNDTFAYPENGDKVKIENAALSVTPLACGKSAELDGEFTITTPTNEKKETLPVFLD